VRSDVESGLALTEHAESKLENIVRLVTLVIAAALPALSIFALYFVKRTTIRLGIIMAFSMLFSACLVVFTNARKVEIFTAVAA
jgi:hypothetical protein